MSEYTQKINEQFIQEIENYKQSPVPACNEKTALKLLAEYRRDSIKFARKFWPDPVAKYLPAVSQGTMFLAQENYPHNEALKIAIERADALCYKVSPMRLSLEYQEGFPHTEPFYLLTFILRLFPLTERNL